jgi:hypothetical protein
MDGYPPFSQDYRVISIWPDCVASIGRKRGERRYNRIQCVGTFFGRLPKSIKIDARL